MVANCTPASSNRETNAGNFDPFIQFGWCMASSGPMQLASITYFVSPTPNRGEF